MLKVENLSKFYEFRKHFYLKKETICIFENINFSLNLNENLLITGQSGAGKSTLAKIIAMLEKPSSGGVFFENLNLCELDFKSARKLRLKIQYVFQEQKLALNPYKKCSNLFLEPFENFGQKPDLTLIDELFYALNLDKKILTLKPLQLSSGQALRFGLLRALCLRPKLLILDEITSALDLKNSAQILDFLKAYQKEQRQISFIFITHQKNLFKNFKCENLKL